MWPSKRPRLEDLATVRQFKRSPLGLQRTSNVNRATFFTNFLPLSSAAFAALSPSVSSFFAFTSGMILGMFGQEYTRHCFKQLDKSAHDDASFSQQERASFLADLYLKTISTEEQQKPLPSALLSQLIPLTDTKRAKLPPLQQGQILQAQIKFFYFDAITKSTQKWIDTATIPKVSPNLLAPAETLNLTEETLSALTSFRDKLYAHPVGKEIQESFKNNQSPTFSSARKLTNHAPTYGINLLSLVSCAMTSQVMEGTPLPISPLLVAGISATLSTSSFLLRRQTLAKETRKIETSLWIPTNILETAHAKIEQEFAKGAKSAFFAPKKRPEKRQSRVCINDIP